MIRICACDTHTYTHTHTHKSNQIKVQIIILKIVNFNISFFFISTDCKILFIDQSVKDQLKRISVEIEPVNRKWNLQSIHLY